MSFNQLYMSCNHLGDYLEDSIISPIYLVVVDCLIPNIIPNILSSRPRLSWGLVDFRNLYAGMYMI